MVWTQNVIGREEETGCLSLWLGRSVPHSFHLLHAWLNLEEKKIILALAVGTTQMWTEWKDDFFCLFVTTSYDLKDRFVSDFSAAEAKTLITLFRNNRRKISCSVFHSVFSVLHFRWVWHLCKIPDLLETFSLPSFEVEDRKPFPKLICAASHKTR